MITLLRRIHFCWFFFWIILLFLLFAPIYYVATRKPAFYGFLNKVRAFNSFLCTAIAGVFFTFTFEEEFDRNKTYIYCANHTSSIDIMVMCLLARGRFHFMGKEELMRNPFWGMFFRTIDIPVSRESKISAFRAFKRAGENLEQGMSLIIFPEGKIGEEYPPLLHEFKNGPFRLAIEKNVPIVPVTIINIWQMIWDDGFRYGTRPGTCRTYVHKPINTLEMEVTNADALKDLVYKEINSKMNYGEN
ncbi:MAG: 1-acyl-sn-glycerol-3-phosphate acyltransferase [Sphingobacteriales bacterium]|nr:MAG: 1-acyl-sn-glycerol-3-phosphate acyltransferase [Sphingobacteriales bacterium]